MPSDRLAKIALALAVMAVVLVGAMTFVVATRGRDRSRTKAVENTLVARADVQAGTVVSLKVSAHDVVRIDRSTVDAVTDPRGPRGIKINDAALRDALQLDASDVIVAISGKAVRRQFDVYDALLGASMMNASALFVELQHAGKPRLVKWELDGDLREARTGVASRPTRAMPITLAPDPFATTVKKLDDRVYEVPRSTFEQVGTALVVGGGSPGLRVFSAYRGGSAAGVRLFAIRPGSIWQAIGLENGDTVTTVNGRGISVTSLRDDFEALRKASALELEMLRNGAAMQLKLSITQ